MDNELKMIENELVKCMKCGFCRSVCPVFLSLGKESTVARGKMGLIESVADGEAELTEGFADKLSLCLMCKACVANCPSGVKVDEAVMAARTLVARKKGLSLPKRIIFRGVLRPKHILPLGARVGAIFQGIFVKKSDRPGTVSMRFPIGLDSRRVIPPLVKVPLRQRRSIAVPTPSPKAKVAFFTGCLMNLVFADMGESVIECLKKLGVHVVVPKDQQCCGLPALVNGDLRTAAELAAANVDIFTETLQKENLDGIVVACASCGSCMKKEWMHTLTASGAAYANHANKARALAPKVYDVSEFLVDVLKIQEQNLKLRPVRRKVTYHDPCHLNRGQGITSQPRQILNLIPGLEFVEMDNPGRCCGSGGSFSLVHYDLSIDINGFKADDIAKTQADAVVTGCPGCSMHIADGLHRKGMIQDVIHTIQLLNESLEA